jgi:5-methylcytosine-specific restriction protein A
MPTRPPIHNPPGGQQRRQRVEVERQQSNGFYRCAPWRRLRSAHLAQFPLCAHCLAEDRIVEASQVDHVVPVKTAPDRILDATNLQSLCQRHHSMKTARENRHPKT